MSIWQEPTACLKLLDCSPKEKEMKSAPSLSIIPWLKTHWILSALLAWQISSIFGQLGISAESTEPYLLFANFHSIKRINVDGSQLDTVFYSNTSNAVGVDYDLRQNYMFWTERERKVIMRSFLDGSNPTVLIAKDVGSSDDLAWDWINEKLYWTNPDNKTIEVYDPSTGYRRVLVEVDQGSLPRAIVVDPSMGWLYWTDWGSEPKIVRTSMDGNNSTVLHNTSLRWPNALTLDHRSQTLYWIDGRLDRIEASNADGSDRKVLMNESISRPFAVSFFQNQLYWSDWSGNTIRTMSIQVPNNVAVVNQFNDLTQDPFGIEVVTAARQPREIANPCANNNGGCTHLCLLSAVGEAGYCCVCPRGIITTECNNECPAPQPSTASPGASTTSTYLSPTPTTDGPCNYNNPCQNGGSCENTGISQYQCLCSEGLGGLHCEIEATHGPCNETAYCLHGGTCINTGHGVSAYMCECVGGYVGTNCESSVVNLPSPVSATVPATVFVGVVGGLVMIIFIMLFLMMCVVGAVRQHRNKDKERSTSSSPSQFMVVNRRVDTPSASEPEYWSIKSNSPAPRISYLTNRQNQNHYVVNTSPAASSQDQNVKDNSQSQWRSKIVTL